MKLTREMIEKEPAGARMDEWIARDVMEWEYWDFEDDYNGSYPMYVIEDDYVVVYEGEGDGDYYFYPSTKIEYAWQVFEKSFDLGYYPEISSDAMNWTVKLVPMEEGLEMIMISDPSEKVAICKALLLAKLEAK